MDEHSPLPWRLEQCKDNGVWYLRQGDGPMNIVNAMPMYGYEGDDDEATAFIVRALNSHDALLAALKRVVDEHTAREVGRWRADRIVIPFDVLGAVRAAIAAAEGREEVVFP